MSAVGEIKASRHIPQRNDTAIKLRIKVGCDKLCNYMYATSQKFGQAFSFHVLSFILLLLLRTEDVKTMKKDTWNYVADRK